MATRNALRATWLGGGWWLGACCPPSAAEAAAAPLGEADAAPLGDAAAAPLGEAPTLHFDTVITILLIDLMEMESSGLRLRDAHGALRPERTRQPHTACHPAARAVAFRPVASNHDRGRSARKGPSRLSLPEEEAPRTPLPTALSASAFSILLIFIAVAPFPYGAILPGGNLEIELFAFVIAALAFMSRPADAQLGALRVPIYSLMAIAALGVFQLFPLSSDLLSRLSPVSLQTHQSASQILALFGRSGTKPVISIAPEETRATILLTLAFAALLASSAILLTTRSRPRLLTAVLFATAIGQILYAAIMNSDIDRIHGAFVNPNHFAGYLEIALAFAFGTIWAEVLMGRDRITGIRDHGERLEKRAVPLLLRVVLWGVIATGIALTRSRGGMLTSAVVTLVLLVMATLQRS